MRSLYILFVLSTLVCVLGYQVNTQMSFSSPFKDFDYSGSRRISGWECYGDAVINEHFIRLTPDRQSKSGACWSNFMITEGSWVTTIKFRISGQGVSLYGDGFSVFFTDQPSFFEGKMWGASDMFTGFAIGFSTFRNSDFSRFHRDIALYVGDGEHPAFIQDKDHTGCYSKYRFQEKRQDFSVDNYAVVKIGYDHTTKQVRVSIDENNSGNFHVCFTDHITLPNDWWRNAHIGISASTGQLADNHDILAVETILGTGDVTVVTESPSAEEEEIKKEENEMFMKMINRHSVNVNALDANEQGLLKVIEAFDQEQRRKLGKMERELEHKIVAVDDSLNNMIKKLQERGDVSEGRIQSIEASLKRDVQNSITKSMEKRVTDLEKAFDQSVKAAVSKSTKQWVVPFVIVVGVVGMVVVVLYSKYTSTQKRNLL